MNPNEHVTQCYLYQVKAPEDPFILINRNVSKKLLEIVPFGKDHFDFFSFIDFACFVSTKFYSGDVINGKYTYHIRIYHSNDPNCKEDSLFRIDFSKELTSINVSMKNGLERIRKYIIYQNGIPCIHFCDEDQIDNDGPLSHLLALNDTKTVFRYSQFKNTTLIVKVARFFASDKRYCPICIKTFFEQFQDEKTQRRKKKLSRTDNIKKMFQTIPGIVNVELQADKLGGYVIVDDNENRKSIQSISVAFPWAKTIFHQCQYLELDASFKGTSPYAYVIINCILNNESIPIGVTIGSGETNELYLLVAQICQKVEIDIQDWAAKPILSDMGAAIEHFCNELHARHYFCHRHLIEHFGSNSALVFFVRRLLNCYSYQKYLTIKEQIQTELNIYLYERKKQNKIESADFLLKINQITEMLNENEPDSLYGYHRWGLWVRAKEGVATCSNHSESLHHYVNQGLTNSYYTFPTQFSNLIEALLRHITNYENNKYNSQYRMIKSRIEYCESHIQNVKDSFNFMMIDNCDCEKGFFLSQLYGCCMRCEHEMLTPAKQIIKDIEKLSSIEITKELILSILHEIHPMSELNLDFISALSTKLHSTEIFADIEQLHIYNLIIELQQCFLFQKNKQIEIGPNFNVNVVKYNESDNQIEIKNTNKRICRHISPVDIEFDQFFWERNAKDNEGKYIKCQMGKVISEIESVYPELHINNKSYSICFDVYEDILADKTRNEQIDLIPEFRIQCWKNADIMMNQKIFFK